MNGCEDGSEWFSGSDGSVSERDTAILRNWVSATLTPEFWQIREKATGVLPAARFSRQLFLTQSWRRAVFSISVLTTNLSKRKLRNRRVPNGTHGGVRGRQAK